MDAEREREERDERQLDRRGCRRREGENGLEKREGRRKEQRKRR